MAGTRDAAETPLRRYVVNIKDQVKDGLISADDMIAYLRDKMKVRNSKIIAGREIEFVDNATSVDVVSKYGNIIKKNMKLYIKRFLRSKALKEFIKVSGDSVNGFNLEYVNKVDDAEE